LANLYRITTAKGSLVYWNGAKDDAFPRALPLLKNRNGKYMASKDIIVRGARMHNLKNIDITIPKHKLVVITGLSGSGKSSLAFDTIYAEGQRRYIESLSAYARQFLNQMEKPDVDSIDGLSPAISIEQRHASKNPRSTVGTSTEIYDYLRLLFARIGRAFCPSCKRPITHQSVSQICDTLLHTKMNAKLSILAPIASNKKGQFVHEFETLCKSGFARARIDGKTYRLSDIPTLKQHVKHTIDLYIDRLHIKDNIRPRLADSINTGMHYGKGLIKILTHDDQNNELIIDEQLFSETHACPYCDISLPEITPQSFSFNSPKGACPTCDGIGTHRYFDPDLIIPDKTKSLSESIIPWKRMRDNDRTILIHALADHYKFNAHSSFEALSQKIQNALLHGSGKEKIIFSYISNNQKKSYKNIFEGIVPNLNRRLYESKSTSMHNYIEQFMTIQPCPTCHGTRLQRESLCIYINDHTIHDICVLSINDCMRFMKSLNLTGKDLKIAKRIIKEIKSRLSFLINVGLDYLSLHRQTGTLSGGEDQRIRLATQIGSALTGVLYVLDEPSIGLHQRDNARLIQTLLNLRNLGNTVLVVEHDSDTMLAADYIVDLGPGAGHHGGQIIAKGTPKQIMRSSKSLTGRYLSGKESMQLRSHCRVPSDNWLCITDAHANNLKHIDVKFPIGLFSVVTGVSGSGKSSLINDTLLIALKQRLSTCNIPPGPYNILTGWEHFSKIIDIDQSPIGRTPRSNPATYTGIFTHIRELFSELPESKVRGYKPGRFSFNVKGGRCEACDGDGMLKIEMHFMPDVYVQCDTCLGKRFNTDTLDITYKGKTIADILAMPIADAYAFFKNIPSIHNKLQTLMDVGLDYIELGQSATTLSGGEAQRIKLARELSKRSNQLFDQTMLGKTLYILDEPTTGLHFDDIRKLLQVLNQLVEAGNTVIVIEHNLDVISFADYCIDLGPEGGDKGGFIVAKGSPQEISMQKKSHTGHFLKQHMQSSNL